MMKTKSLGDAFDWHSTVFVLVLTFLNTNICVTRAQGTAFTYQGRLIDGGVSANGNYDLTFALFSTSNGGSGLAGPITNSFTCITSGLITATLDFGASFSG